MTAPRFRLIATERREWPFRLRLPFRFGVITVTHGRQAVVTARIRLEDGREAEGIAAETLAAKWFDKDPRWTDAQNEDQLRRALEIASDATLAAGTNTAFGHFAESWAPCEATGAAEGLNPLVVAYGRALLDRAILDALLRAHDMSFFAGMQANIGGLRPHAVCADLGDFDFDRMLDKTEPATTIQARHTVGLVDPITIADQAERVGDGLPEALEEVAGIYGHWYWKLKVGGNVEADVDRLCRIAAVLDIGPRYHATLDGNEQYEDAEGAAELWRAMEREPRLDRLRASILFIEQPVKRAKALSVPMTALATSRPVIVDESDGPMDAFVTARGMGYSGVSTKACKGIWRSLINHARCRAWNAEAGDYRHFMSAEDLTTLPGTCVQQDLALVALMGITHVERNGHHFIAGFEGRPEAEAERFALAHPDLYGVTRHGPRLRIRNGALEIGSLDTPGLGATVMPDLDAMQPMPRSEWRAP
ncbi:mandelate racemase [Roseomonas sp. CCTCC AB2023176]|uniref:mandelate racemase n=1 Tax=Roseomonas sp. CCTCC AB2023176 TaxID=3342640 RepID=UPI0035E2101C